MAAKRRRARKRDASTGGVQLPALSTLHDLPAYDELTPSDAQRAAAEADKSQLVADGIAEPDELALAFVCRLDRGYPALCWEGGVFRAEFATRLTKDDGRVAVGDWVVARLPGGNDMGLVQTVLPRESDIARWRGSNRGERQTLAANVDVVIAAYALGDREPDMSRIARSVVVALDCGAHAAVVLTKADRCTDADAARAAVSRVLGADVPVVLTSSEMGEGIDDVRALVPAGTSGMLLGASGAGKSTLLNALLGRDVLETGAVRASDDAGRHTTVARRMVSIPGAGVIVDEPGLRSLPLVGHERGLALAFPDIADAARTCRFRDCTHDHEPGCGVRAAAAEGAFDEGALGVYLALASEMRASAGTLDPDVVL